jgi:hypothetical protein
VWNRRPSRPCADFADCRPCPRRAFFTERIHCANAPTR